MKTMILLDHLGYSQANYELFRSINKLVEETLEEISVVPIDRTNKIIPLKTAATNIGSMSAFNGGLLVSTTIKNAERILACKTRTSKLLYLYDLEWMYKKIPYDNIYSILNDPSLFVVLRSRSHVEAFRQISHKRELGIVDEFRLEEIWNLLE
jgi:hypothetical protein